MRVGVRADNLPPAVLCHWPARDGDSLRPLEPEEHYVAKSRGPIRLAAGRQVMRLAERLRRVGGRLAYKRIVLDD